MISDSDKWVPDVNMSFKDRAIYVALGFAVLFVVALPYIPMRVWDAILMPLAVLVGGAGASVAGWLIVKGIRGRW